METGADASVVCSMALLQDDGPVMVAGAEMLDVTSLDIGRRSQVRQCCARAADVPLDRVRIIGVRSFRRRQGVRLDFEIAVDGQSSSSLPLSQPQPQPPLRSRESSRSRARAQALAQELSGAHFELNLNERLLDVRPPLPGAMAGGIEVRVQSTAVLVLGEL